MNEFKILHLTARIFMQPNKSKLDIKKIKTGKLYMTSKKYNSSEQMTISKINEQKDVYNNVIKINRVRVKFYGKLVKVKKVLIFEKII